VGSVDHWRCARAGGAATCIVAWLTALTTPARAQPPAPAPSMTGAPPVEIHGFVSQGALWTTSNNYLAESDRGSVEFVEAGLNFTAQLTDSLRVGAQLFTRDLGPVGNYDAKMDWLYLDYRWHEVLGLRAGRVKIPFGLYNEISDIDAARVPVLLPQSIYPIENRDILLAQTGLELYGYLTLGAAGALDYHLYGGTIHVGGGGSSGPVTISPFRVPYVAGGRVMWETPLDGLRLGGSFQAVRLDFDLTVATLRAEVQFPVRLAVGSLEYVGDNLLLAAEYGRWYGKIISTNQMLFPDTKTTNERMYALAAYRLATWFCPGAYYAILYPNVDDRKGRDAWQHDVALTLRFDVNRHWLIKLEGHYMKGTAFLDDALNGGRELSELDKHWGLFLVKTTATF
jgi:hypothetical protein